MGVCWVSHGLESVLVCGGMLFLGYIYVEDKEIFHIGHLFKKSFHIKR